MIKGTREFIVGFCSKKFANSEVNWNIVEKESFAILHNVKHFHHFLIGQNFTIKCDNRVVSYLRDKNSPRSKKMLNWALQLSDYDYHVEHIPSKNNNIADCLSRLLHVTPIIFSETLSIPDFINEQSLDCECSAAKMYLAQNRKHFDVKLLGSLKPFRRNLNVTKDNILL